MDHAELLIMGVPTSAMRTTLEAAKPWIHAWIPIVSLAKGFEQGTLLRMTEVIKEVVPGHPVAALTGPNIAREIMAGQAAATVLASRDLSVASEIQRVLHRGLLRVYTNHDVIGCELGGALKNVVAIACGMAEGLGVGDNTRSMVMTRGLAELTRLGVAMGGEPETFSGLAGMGDMITTCISPHSRNRHVGEQLGLGRKLNDILGEMSMVAEGVKTADHRPRSGRQVQGRHAGVSRDLPGREGAGHPRQRLPGPAGSPGPRARPRLRPASPHDPGAHCRRGRLDQSRTSPSSTRCSDECCGSRCGWSITPTGSGPPGEVKVGGHQASSASMVSIMTALWFAHLSGDDKVAVKPHASPVFHAIKYLTGELDRSYLTRLRELGGLQSYPSRTKDPDVFDFSTGSVGLGVVAPLFAAATRRYVTEHFGRPSGEPTAAVHRAGRRRRARRGQRVGGDHRPVAAGSRQRDVDRRHQPSEPRSGRARAEDQEADGVLRGRGLARRSGQVRRPAAGRLRPPGRRRHPAPHRCDVERGVPVALRPSRRGTPGPLPRQRQRRHHRRRPDRRRARRRVARHWCRTSPATTSACSSTPSASATP